MVHHHFGEHGLGDQRAAPMPAMYSAEEEFRSDLTGEVLGSPCAAHLRYFLGL
jgi:hypothetical protein